MQVASQGQIYWHTIAALIKDWLHLAVIHYGWGNLLHCQSMRTLKKHLLHLNIFHLITNVLRMTNEHLCYTFTPLFPFLPFTNKVCVTLAEMPQLEPISPQPATHTVKYAINLACMCVSVSVCAHIQHLVDHIIAKASWQHVVNPPAVASLDESSQFQTPSYLSNSFTAN